MNKLLVLFLLVTSCSASESTVNRPHIVFILADDLGWNDVAFHGSGQIPTPNIDALAYSGLIMNNYYVTAICTPSRSALMTGKYPIHTGMQHSVLFGGEARGLPLAEKLLPEYLKELGYTNRIVGKWHLGSYTKEYTPTYRGFDSHLGYWTGHQDYFDHTAVEAPGWGLDMRRNMDVAYDLHGSYSTDVFAKEAVNVINSHNSSTPLFLYLAHAAVHSGNPYNPLPAPDETVEKFDYITDYKRQRFAAIMSKLDDSVGAVVNALAERNMLENSVIIFSTDNGGAAAGFNLNAASNYPLRGVKNTLWEGGVRGAGLLWSPLIKQPQRVARQFMHISDWLPTLLSIAGGNVSQLENIDGVDQWQSLSEDLASTRTAILHNIDDIYGNAALTVGTWKLVKGTTYNGTWDNWYGPSGRDYDYNATLVIDSVTGQALKSINISLTPEMIEVLRNFSTISCSNSNIRDVTCKPVEASCLFNITEDPCEMNNLADEYPEILKSLEETLIKFNNTAVLPGNLPLDPRGDPKYWNYTWTNFGDYINEHSFHF
jgi:arylsulfatase B